MFWRSIVLLAMTVSSVSAETLTLTIDGGVTLRAEVAQTEEERRHGLSGRTDLAADAGMLFVFSSPRRVCMWMQGTPLPLAVAFINAAGRIIQVAQMQPNSRAIHCSDEDVPYALETNPQLVEDGILTVGAQLSGH